MADPYAQSEGQGQLVMRGYRRHRRHSRWGLIALFCPAATMLWAAFWYLMMNQVQDDPNAPPVSYDTEVMVSMIGCLVFAIGGIGMSVFGLMNRRTRHHLASAGLTVNIVHLLALVILILLGAF